MIETWAEQSFCFLLMIWWQSWCGLWERSLLARDIMLNIAIKLLDGVRTFFQLAWCEIPLLWTRLEILIRKMKKRDLVDKKMPLLDCSLLICDVGPPLNRSKYGFCIDFRFRTPRASTIIRSMITWMDDWDLTWSIKFWFSTWASSVLICTNSALTLGSHWCPVKVLFFRLWEAGHLWLDMGHRPCWSLMPKCCYVSLDFRKMVSVSFDFEFQLRWFLNHWKYDSDLYNFLLHGFFQFETNLALK